MGASKQERRRLTVVQMYNACQRNKKEAVRLCQELKIAPSTAYRIITKYEATNCISRRSGSGRIAKAMPTRKKQQLRRRAEHRIGSSCRKLASVYNISKSYAHKIIKEQGLSYYKRKKTPKTSEKQEKVIKTRVRRLHDKMSMERKGCDVIMDDESYFSICDHRLSENSGFYSLDPAAAPNDVKYKQMEKFPPKIMVWVAVSPRGISTPFFLPVSHRALTADTYKAILSKHLLPFIRRLYPDGDYVFWPDLASCHYATSVREFLAEENIPFVEKTDNPPNCPQLRPIENFWAMWKSRVYANGWEAQTVQQLTARMKRKLKEVDMDAVQRMMEGVRRKLRKAKDSGVRSVL